MKTTVKHVNIQVINFTIEKGIRKQGADAAMEKLVLWWKQAGAFQTRHNKP